MTRGKRTQTRLGWRWLTAAGMTVTLAAGILVTGRTHAQGNSSTQAGSAKTALKKYARDISAAAEQGRFDSFTERQDETKRAIQVLARDHKNNPVVLTESQAVRDLVTISVARKIAHADVPEELLNRRVYKLDLDSLFRDSKTAAELKSNVAGILSEIAKSNSKIILLIDPIQSLLGRASAFEGAVSSLLRDAIRNGDLQCLGASTELAFQQNVANEESLASLFSGIEMQGDADLGQSEENARSTDSSKKSTEEFVGDRISDDLRELIESGQAPVRVKAILQVNDTNSKALRAQLTRYGVRVDAQMPSFGTLAVDVPTDAIKKLAGNANSNYLSLDRPIEGLGHVKNTTGAQAMLSQPGNSFLDGSGIGIAVLDSGISSKQKSLLNRVVFSKDFTGEGTTEDPYGHGTFVAGLIASKQGSYGGIATSANLINFRVLNSQGTGTLSMLLSALDAVLANRNTYNIRVVNLSLGTAAVDSYKNDALCRAVRRLVDAGIVVVTAAGNEGKDAAHPKLYGRIHSPGNEPSAITVGAANTFGTDFRSDDTVASYSSRGPTRSYWKDWKGVKHYDNLIKPDLVAPGNKIIGDAAPENKLESDNPELCVAQCGKSSGNGKGTMRLSGTSVAAPIVAAAVAVLLEANPRLTPNMIKMIVMYTAQPLAQFNMLEQGAGELNIEGAVRLAKLVRTDLFFFTPVGAPLLTSAAPTPSSIIAGQTVKWSQGVLFKYDWAMGTALITKYQAVYGQGVLLGDGVLITNGVLSSDTTMLSSGVLLGDNIMVSNGITMSDGAVLMSSAVLLGDGVLLSDGTVVSDGVLMGDGTIVTDGTLVSDYILGDQTSAMPEE